MVETLTAVVAAILVSAVLVAVHLTRGVGWRAREDLSDAILDHRASTLAETDYPEPMSRAPGAGGPAAVGAPAEGAEGELEEGEAETTAADEGPWSVADDEAEVFEIEYTKEGQTLEVPENQTLLEAGEEEGWDLPFACREGQCLSCGGHIVDGPADDFVVHHNQQMLESPELEDGYVLTCCAYPQGDFSLETGETP
ncbi:MAG: 2Fe-2S iron-sulfur cluster-binding protein [Halobacteriales archaeon]